mmetsp:Transcript_54990/g.134569  ORF Transcript_54990/g.134569 Transcript_54990/m.134569 type:complete len:220 (+) Transcript_54990:746-1405(+)
MARVSITTTMMCCPSSHSRGSWLMIVCTPRMSTMHCRAASSPASAATPRAACRRSTSSCDASRSARIGTAPASIAPALCLSETAKLASAYTAWRWISAATPRVKGRREFRARCCTVRSSSCMLSSAAASAMERHAIDWPVAEVPSVVRLRMERSTQPDLLGSAVRCLAHSVHTRTLSLLTPGMAMLWGLHRPHTTWPQQRQWCLRLTTVNSVSHSVHMV